MYELDFKSFFSILDRKIGYIDVPRTLSGLLCIDHLDCSHIVLIESSESLHRKSKITKDRAQILCSFRGGSGGNEFSFSIDCAIIVAFLVRGVGRLGVSPVLSASHPRTGAVGLQ